MIRPTTVLAGRARQTLAQAADPPGCQRLLISYRSIQQRETSNVHKRGIHRRGSSDHQVHSVQVALPEENEATVPPDMDPAHVLVEWRLLEERMQSIFHNTQNPSKELHTAEVETAHPGKDTMSSEFFSSNRVGTSPTSMHTEGSSKDMDTYKASLWIASLDEQVLDLELRQTTFAILSGKRNITSLAETVMGALDDGEPISEREYRSRLNQVRFSILGHWVQTSREALVHLKRNVRHVRLLVDMTKDLYESLQISNANLADENIQQAQEMSETTHSDHLYSSSLETKDNSAVPWTATLAIQRAVLHRLYTFFYESAALSMGLALDVTLMCLANCSVVVRDTRLKPSQARYLYRKMVARLHKVLAQTKDKHIRSPVWQQVPHCAMKLFKNGVFLPGASTNDMESTLLLWSSAVRQRTAPVKEATAALLSISRCAKYTGAGTLSEKESRAIVSTKSLSKIVGNLLAAGKSDAALKLYFMAPPWQRSHKTSVALMTAHSSVKLQFHDGKVVSCMEGDARSRRLLDDLLSSLDLSSALGQRIFKEAIIARSSGHVLCKRLDLGRQDMIVYNEVMKHYRVYQGPSSDVLLDLGDGAQLNFVRQLVTCGRWEEALRLTSKLLDLRRSHNKLANTGDDAEPFCVDADAKSPSPPGPHSTSMSCSGSTNAFAVRLLNTLLSASLQKKWVRASVFRRAQRISSLSRREQVCGVNRRAQLHRNMTFLERFATEKHILPDGVTSVVLVAALSRCRRSAVSSQALNYIAHHLDWNWAERGVCAILGEIRDVLKNGKGIPSPRVVTMDSGSLDDDPFARRRGDIARSRASRLSSRKPRYPT